MNKLIKVFAAVFLISFLLIFLVDHLNKVQGYSGKNTLTVYNWGDYIDPELLDRFEEETGIKVIYETFDSNEAMMTKIQQGGTSYDVAVPSEYAIEKMKDAGLLLKIDHTKVPNLKNIDERFLDLPFDPENEYSVPYFWGTVGIVFNPDLLADKEFHSWNDLWDEDLKNQILLIDGARESIGFALNSLNYSLNETDRGHLQEARDKLIQLHPNIKAIVGDEIKMLMVNEEAPLAITWSGDAADMMWENEVLDYVVPEEGSNLWFDNMVIPKTARNVEGAHQFINFMLDAEVGAQNTDYVGYSTPNKEAMKLLPEETVADERFYPSPELTERLEVYKNLGQEMLSYYNDLYLEFKMAD